MKAPSGTPIGARQHTRLTWGVHARLARSSSTRRSAAEPGRAGAAARPDSVEGVYFLHLSHLGKSIAATLAVRLKHLRS